jgi:hypothetical protein
MSKKGYVFAWLLAGCVPYACASPIPSELKKAVAFIYVQQKGSLQPDGTAFFVSVPSEADSSQLIYYIVTAKHVLTNGENGPWWPQVAVRTNTRGGESSIVPLDVITGGPHRNVFASADPTVDLAVALMPAQMKSDEMTAFPVNQITAQEDFPRLRVSEGTDVFFVGMFVPHIGERRN